MIKTGNATWKRLSKHKQNTLYQTATVYPNISKKASPWHTYGTTSLHKQIPLETNDTLPSRKIKF